MRSGAYRTVAGFLEKLMLEVSLEAQVKLARPGSKGQEELCSEQEGKQASKPRGAAHGGAAEGFSLLGLEGECGRVGEKPTSGARPRRILCDASRSVSSVTELWESIGKQGWSWLDRGWEPPVCIVCNAGGGWRGAPGA